MARIDKTIAGRITLSVLAAHMLILPALYFGMVYLLKQGNEELFLNNSLGHARFLADSLERIGNPQSKSEIVEILDSIVLSGGGVFSELRGDTTVIPSSLVSAADAALYNEDFNVGEHDDQVYYISMPVLMGNEHLNFRVGFDEAPIVEQNTMAYKNGLLIIAAYLVVLILLLPLIGARVARPVRELQRASRQVASGAASQALTVESDLVEIVELAQDLERMKSRLLGVNAQLEKEIEEREHAEQLRRSLELQLRHSQRLETVGTMAGGIAHELNNILVPIILYTDTAIEDLPEESTVRSDLVRVIRAASRAKGIVNQVLTFSHKMASSAPVTLDMTEVVQESIELLRASLPASVTLDYSIDPECPPVIGDAALMGQLILNLSTNALQSLRESKGSIDIKLDAVDLDDQLAAKHPLLTANRLVRLTVGDSGRGMDKQTQERIFEPFFTTRPVGEGTGLGLSVVHGIVTDLGGAIDVTSAPDRGSVFVIYIPASQGMSYSSNMAIQV